MTITKPVRACLYARVSTTGHGQGTCLQLEELRRVAEARGWDMVQEFVDQGVSGAKERPPPALDALMKAARAGEVAVWRFDRFARNVNHLLKALDEFRTLGVEFLSLRENIETTTPMGRAMFTLCTVVSELELASPAVEGRVAPGGRPPGAPTDPDVRNSRIRLLELGSLRSAVDRVDDPHMRQGKRRSSRSRRCHVILTLPPRISVVVDTQTG